MISAYCCTMLNLFCSRTELSVVFLVIFCVTFETESLLSLVSFFSCKRMEKSFVSWSLRSLNTDLSRSKIQILFNIKHFGHNNSNKFWILLKHFLVSTSFVHFSWVFPDKFSSRIKKGLLVGEFSSSQNIKSILQR